jgi:pSer/pThr/pTyr-binding forkhead associated (FHA) protein
MSPESKVLGVLKPRGGGDEIPLLKNELVVGRRPSCDIVLDFSNVSGKHCKLRLINSIWHVRDLGSTNGTSINGQRQTSEHSLMPDDELAIATHSFLIDYEPGGPETVVPQHELLEAEGPELRPRRSLRELAGLDADDNKPRHRTGHPQKDPEEIERLSADFEDVLPEDVKNAPNPVIETSDSDFFKLIEEDLKKSKD